VEWTIKLEARSGWGEVETIEVGRLKRRVAGLTAGEVGLTLAEGRRNDEHDCGEHWSSQRIRQIRPIGKQCCAHG
jgi:hypothetical protein